MPRAIGLLVVGLTVALAACSGPEREWMKVNQPYTAEDFRRDVAECMRGGKLDEACMKGRGWVSVSPQKVDKAPEPLRAPASPRYR